jgi:hypothetical protein
VLDSSLGALHGGRIPLAGGIGAEGVSDADAVFEPSDTHGNVTKNSPKKAERKPLGASPSDINQVENQAPEWVSRGLELALKREATMNPVKDPHFALNEVGNLLQSSGQFLGTVLERFCEANKGLYWALCAEIATFTLAGFPSVRGLATAL